MSDSQPPDYSMIVASTAVESEFEPAIGCSDPLLAEERRRLMESMKTLYGTGIQSDLDVPMVAVIGSQSSGKSSLIEAISGITLPRSVGTCTRCPIECHLFRMSEREPWSCRVSLRFLTDPQGLRYSQARNVSFGDIIGNPLQVEERIRRAQAAILTPDESPESFLNKSIRDLTPAATFSANLISLDIRGPSIQEELSFIDLPGLIRNVGSSGNAGDITLIENLVKSYIIRPSCIILLTIACETDFANQEGYTMARTYDPEGVRTIGVLTKPDRIDAGGESRWLSFIRGEEEHLSNGWFCVKQPDAQGLIKNTSWEAARSEEAAFFSKNEAWSSLEDRYHNRLQTKNLFRSLSNLLSKVIKDRLPDLKAEVRNLLDSTESELHTLPKAKSNDVVSDFLRLILSFSRAVKDHVSPLKDDGLLHKVKSEKGRFRKEVQSTALDFRPWPRDAKDAFKKLSPPDFLGDDHTTLFGISVAVMPKARRGSGSSEILDDGKVVFLDEVAGKVYRASSRELFDGYPTEVMQDFSRRCIDEWKAPTLRFIEQIAAMTCNAVRELVQDHFKHYTSGGIQKWVINMVDDHVKACKAKAIEHVEMLLLAEHSIDTGNTQDFRLYKDKFLAYYKSHRQQASGSTFFKEIDSKPYNANAPYPAKAEFQAGMVQAKAAFAKLGLPEVQPADFAKFMSSDPSEPMLEIMASVSAYLQVAFKRFTDYVPLIVDHCLVYTLTDDSLGEKLKGKMNLSDPATSARCNSLLQEPPLLAETRARLESQLTRLKVARQELFREEEDVSDLFS